MKLKNILGRPQWVGEAALRWPLAACPDPAALRASLLPLPGVQEVVFSEAWVMLRFDPAQEPPPWEQAELLGAQALLRCRLHELRVRYDGPDLSRIAAWSSLSIEEVVARHAAPLYSVLYLGFLPGFAYLGEVDPRIAAPRLPSPRHRVAANSLALAERRCAIYPRESPGGWNLLGTVLDFQAFDLAEGPALHPGDQLRFLPV